MVLLRKRFPQKCNLQTAAELSVKLSIKEKLMRKIVLLSSLFVSSLSVADEFYDGIEGICTKDRYIIEYFSAYNEEGIKLYNLRAGRSQKECALGGDVYKLVPLSSGVSERGMCGGYELIYINVEKNGNLIFSEPAVASCMENESYISKIEFVKGFEKPEVTRTNGDPW